MIPARRVSLRVKGRFACLLAAGFFMALSGLVPLLRLAAGAQAQAGGRRLVWVDREGKVEPIPAPPRAYALPRLSPDRKSIAVEIGPPFDIWVYEIQAGELRQFTSTRNTRFPLWSVDGKRLLFGDASGPGKVYWKAADGTGEAELLISGPHNLGPQSWSPDGSILSYYEIHPDTSRDIWMLPMKGSDRKPWVFLATKALEGGAVFSPDGKWLAYSSDKTGRREIYVQAFDPAQPPLLISDNGGVEPMWAHSGKEVFYREDDKRKSVRISTSPVLKADPPQVMFQGPFQASPGTRANYDVAPDDQRFLMVMP